MVMATAVVIAGGCRSDHPNDGAGGTTVPGSLAVDSTTVAPPAVTNPDLVAFPPGFVVPDDRNAALTPVTGKPKPDPLDHSLPLLPIAGGTGRIQGTVLGPDGPVEGATVRLERVVGFDFGRLDVVTDKAGRFDARDLLGGRFRVRAWVTADALATVEPQLTFLPATDGARTVDVAIVRRDGLFIEGALDVATPAVNQPAPFTALIAQELVDDQGVVRGRGIPAALVRLLPGAGVGVTGGLVAPSDADGFVHFTLTCLALGVFTVDLDSSGVQRTITLPECVAPDPAATTTTAATSTSLPGSPPAPGSAGATTTTTRPPTARPQP
jgi:hypothetical protein